MSYESIFAIRRENLRGLARKYCTQQEFAARLEREEPVISRYLSGSRNIGTAFARHVETFLNLSSGWLDYPHPSVQPGALLSILESLVASKPSPRVIDSLAALMIALTEENVSDSNSGPESSSLLRQDD